MERGTGGRRRAGQPGTAGGRRLQEIFRRPEVREALFQADSESVLDVAELLAEAAPGVGSPGTELEFAL